MTANDLGSAQARKSNTESRAEVEAHRVVRTYENFSMLRNRAEAFDEGDAQNVHEWMRAVTDWIAAHPGGGAS